MSMMGTLRVHDKARAGAPDTHPDAAGGFRLAMREFASGVTIVATGQGEERYGCTASAVASLSMNPPSLIVCLNQATTTLAALRREGAFSVNILAAHQQALAERFAGRDAQGAARFAKGDWGLLATGAPVLMDALAAIDCRVEDIVDRHTHAIVIGAVEAVRLSGAPSALLHWRSRFETLA